MKLLATCAALFAAAVCLRADLVLLQRVEGSGQAADQLIHIKGQRARCDIGKAISVIIDHDAGETFTLSHEQKTYVTVPADRSREMIAAAQKARNSTEPLQLFDTGKREKVAGYDCEIYTFTTGVLQITYWLAKTYPDYPKLLEQLDILESAAPAGAANSLAPRTIQLPGLPMKILLEKDKQKVLTTFISARGEPVDPAVFELPAGYKQLPSLPPVKTP